MNKVTAAVLAAAMIGSMAMPVFAADIKGTGTESTNNAAATVVKYNVTGEYTWNIHSDIDFGKDRTDATGGTKNNQYITNGDGSSTNKVEVTKNVIPTGKNLVITVAGNGGLEGTTAGDFKIKTSDNAELDYTVTSSAQKGENNATGEVSTNGTVLVVAAGTNTGETYMTFKLDTTTKDSEYAGSYTGRLIYTAKVQ